MAWLHEIIWFCIGRDCRFNGQCAIGCRNSCGDSSSRLNRDREIGTHRGTVVPNHERQIELLATLASQGEANQATTMFGHEIDCLGCDMVSR